MTNEQLAEQALSNIIDYVGADPKYKNYAQLISFIEWAMKRSKVI